MTRMETIDRLLGARAMRDLQGQLERATLNNLALRAELTAGASLPAELQRRLSHAEQELLRLLLGRAVVDVALMSVWLYGLRRPPVPQPSTVKALIYRLRRKLAPYGIAVQNTHTTGYFIEHADKARLRQIDGPPGRDVVPARMPRGGRP